MYRTVNNYLISLQDTPRARRHNVNNARTRRHLLEYRKLSRWSELRDEVLTPDLEYLMDVLDRADDVVARAGDIFEGNVSERIIDEAATQEGIVCVVTKHAGFTPSAAVRDEAFSRLRDLCREKLLDALVAKIMTDARRSSALRAAYRDVTGAELGSTYVAFSRVARHVPIKRDPSRDDLVAAVRRGLAETPADEEGDET